MKHKPLGTKSQANLRKSTPNKPKEKMPILKPVRNSQPVFTSKNKIDSPEDSIEEEDQEEVRITITRDKSREKTKSPTVEEEMEEDYGDDFSDIPEFDDDKKEQYDIRV